jgi:peptidoglycan/LPS O-acetylase OafA/YrhL
MKKDAKVYFPGLNALRFFAAIAVVVTHVELMKKYLGFTNLWSDIWDIRYGIRSTAFEAIQLGQLKWYHPLVFELGPLGVNFFFVLSGFLITYLLFEEKKKTKTVRISHFYVRRILRIWPLYYFVLILGFFVLPQFDLFHVPGQSAALSNHFWENLICYALILPNLAFAIFSENGGAVPNIGQSWSIGVEEQFYLLWPLILKYTKKPLVVIIVSTVLLLVVKFIVLVMLESEPSRTLIIIKNFLVMSKIESMAIGGLGAYFLYYKKNYVLSVIYNPLIQAFSFLLIPALLFFTHRMYQDGSHLLSSASFLIIIMNISSNENSLIKLSGKFLHALGRISYGVYMYHMMVIVFVLNLLKQMKVPHDALEGFNGVLLYFGVIALTLVIAQLSYTYLESFFIRKKAAFTKVISGDAARKKK